MDFSILGALLEYGVLGIITFCAICWAWRERKDRIRIGEKLGKKLDTLQEKRLDDVKHFNEEQRQMEYRWLEMIRDFKDIIKGH